MSHAHFKDHDQFMSAGMAERKDSFNSCYISLRVSLRM